MNFMGIHFCQDEAYALMLAVPFIGLSVSWVRSKYEAYRQWRSKKVLNASSR